MAGKSAAKAAGKSGKAAGGRGATLYIVIGTVMAVTALPMCLLFVAGMLPTIVAAIVDRHRARYLARAVAVMNLAGMVQPVIALLQIGMSIAGAEHVLSDARMWLMMYGAAAIGWLLNMGMPSIARIMVDMKADQLQQQLEARAAVLKEEWGEEVAGEKE
jgi:hypothetical protein